MNKAEQMSAEIKKRSKTLITAILNAFCEDEERTEITEPLTLKTGDDLKATLTAIIFSAKLLAVQFSPQRFEEMNAIDWSHFVNKLMIEWMFAESIYGEADGETDA